MNGYPSDEELERLISQLEKQELYAPKHMKEQILSQAFPKQTVEIFPESGSRSRTVQTITYRLKIIAGMAAALVMVMIIPLINDSRRDEADQQIIYSQQLRREQQSDNSEKNIYINEIFSERTREINQRFSSWFEQVNSFQLGVLFDTENGGIYDEN